MIKILSDFITVLSLVHPSKMVIVHELNDDNPLFEGWNTNQFIQYIVIFPSDINELLENINFAIKNNCTIYVGNSYYDFKTRSWYDDTLYKYHQLG
jgi:hypothetical protein